MQIAGSQCKICQRAIILADEGRLCPGCGTFVHVTCLPQAQCDVCGQALECQECREPDPLSEAILPGSLRPAKSGAPVLAIGLAVILLVLVILLGLLMQNIKGK